MVHAIGSPLPEHRVRAHNSAAGSANPIHDDDLARRFGFRAGLVPGVSIYAYMSRSLLGHLGRDWLERGSAEVRFVQPVYDGEEILIRGCLAAAGADGTLSFDLQAVNSRGIQCAAGSAALPPAAPSPEPTRKAYHAGQAKTPRPISLELLRVGDLLTPVTSEFTRRQHWEYCRKAVRDHNEIYEKLLHPGWLLSQANLLLEANYEMPPWIHVSSAVQHFHAQEEECVVETRGFVREKYERRGHHFVVIDAAMFSGDRCLQTVVHCAIFRIAPRAA